MLSPTEFIAEPEVVMLELPATSGEEAVRALLAELVARSDAVVDGERFEDEVLARMRLAPVCIAADVALPHARTEAVSRLVIAVARTRAPTPFDAEHPAVRLIFLIGTPRDAVTEYLRVVAALSRLLRNPAARSGLMMATDEADFRSLLASSVAVNR